MDNKALIFTIFAILINESFQSPAFSPFNDRNKREINSLNNENVNGGENANKPEIIIEEWGFKDGWTEENRWTFNEYEEVSTQSYDDLDSGLQTLRSDDFTNENNYQTDQYLTQDWRQEFTETSNEETTENFNNHYTEEQTANSTIDLQHPCGPLIVNLNDKKYLVKKEKVSTIICNAYFSEHTNSRCVDGSVFYAQFNLKINGQLVIEEYMKRVHMSYEGFYAKFMISHSLLEKVLHYDGNYFRAQCDVTITTDTGSAFNISHESIIDDNNENGEHEEQLGTTEDWINNENNTTEFDTNTTTIDSCATFPVEIHSNSSGLTNTNNPNIAIFCSTNIPIHCDQSSIINTKFELLIDGINMSEIYLTKFSVFYSRIYAQFLIHNSLIESLSEQYAFDYLNAYCNVKIERTTGLTTNSSSMINIYRYKNGDIGSPLNGSCYLSECIADRNLTCEWGQKCKCKYDTELKEYYVPYKKSNVWYCARPAKHNEQCFHTNQCTQLNKGSVCTQTSIGNVCECDQMYYWNGFKCISINTEEVESTTSYYSYYYELRSNYGLAKIVGVSFAGIVGAYILLILGLYIRNKKKQKKVKREVSVNRLFRKKKFVPHIFVTEKSEDKKVIIRDDKIAELRIVE